MKNSANTPDYEPELLAPAGDQDCLRAAVENGANAVYFGLETGFNARARATNFHVNTLAKTMATLHRQCVKGYVTLNTLVFSSELDRVADIARILAESGVDAVLVQDPGVARLLKKICPALALHASTQMTLTSAECIQAVADLGLERVVLPRELSIAEIRQISSKTEMPLEAFVHGALCVAYSGQCLTSESLGGRSANRGQCAQACRLPYDLICDGSTVPLGQQKYLLSPQDLAAFDMVSELVDAGICSFKIEGRLKTPEYVANTVRHYRVAIDEAMAGRRAEFSRQEVSDLEMSFSRGFSPGWLQGCDHKRLVPGTSSTKRGVLIGVVRNVSGQRIEVELQGQISAGDGVVFEGDREKNAEQGGRVFQVFQEGIPITGPVSDGIVSLSFDRSSVRTTEICSGLKIWKTDDPRLNRRLRASFEGHDVHRRVSLNIHVTGITGQLLHLQASAANGACCELIGDQPLEEARRHPLTTDLLNEQLGRLGATVYQLNGLTADIQGNPMLPLSQLGQLRRRMIELLDACDFVRAHPVNSAAPAPATCSGESTKIDIPPRLNFLCRNLQQLKWLMDDQSPVYHEIASEGPLSQRMLYVDFADIREYGEAVRLGEQRGLAVVPATPRIQKPGESGIFQAMLKHHPRAVLVRNLSGLDFFQKHGVPVIADFSLNVTNEHTAAWLMEKGARRLTASYDMNRDQLLDLVAAGNPSWLEVVIHQHMPMFHMEHCVFCSVLSPGTNKSNCGRPCDVHQVHLRDRIGMQHLLTADVGCRNTLFNAVPQSAAEAVPELIQKGVRSFRIEFLEDDSLRMREIVTLYEDLLAGRVTGADVWKKLKASNRVGVTRGTLEERRNPLAIL
ncbi:MAG: DUF3656 domain-containing protein [Planctomycetaceae bacterium]